MQKYHSVLSQAKRVVKAANKLIHFAKKADKGFTSPMNLLKGRIYTEQAYKKLLMETVPKLENVPQNYVYIERKPIRRRRGDNAPMVHVTIKNSEKEEAAKMLAREEREKRTDKDIKAFGRQVLAEEKAYYEKLMNEQPEKADFFKKKIARVEFEEWSLDKTKGEKRVNLLR